MAQYQLRTHDQSKPWANALVEAFGPLSIPLNKLRAPMAALRWRMSDLQILETKVSIHAAMALKAEEAMRQGKPVEAKESPFTADDEVVLTQLSLYASLLQAGFDPKWDEVAGLSQAEFWAAGTDEPEADAEADAEGPEDPQSAPTDSAQADGA